MAGPNRQKWLALEQRMLALGVRKNDILEKFVKSSGRGGQKVNKSASAVFLSHLPSGLSSKCGKHRSQILNRFVALRNLLDKIETKQSGGPAEERSKIDKIRKQKARRKRRAVQKAGKDIRDE